MNYVSLGNPIWSGQVHILGGVRRLAATAAIYGGLIMMSSFLWVRASGGTLAGAVREVLQLLAVGQIGILVLGGLGAVHRALLRDHNTRMIDTSADTAYTTIVIDGGIRMPSVPAHDSEPSVVPSS